MTTNILSLDGGGTWALIQTRALADLYPGESGHAILARFDYAFANSGGSLVLGGLLADLTPKQIEASFTDPVQRGGMYVRTPYLFSAVLRLFGAGAKYSTPAKRVQLGRVFGDLELASLPRRGGGHTHIVIVAFDYVRQRAFLFRSGPSPLFPTVTGVALADAINASTTAPVLYYDRPAEVEVNFAYPGVNSAPTKMQFWDGGVTGMNNPAAAAVAEALAAGAAPGDIAVLSLGTGTVLRSNNCNQHGDPVQLSPLHVSQGAIGDVKELAESIVDDPPDFASFLAHTMTGGRAAAGAETAATRVVRMNPVVLGDWAGEWVRPAWNVAAARGDDLFVRLQTMDMDAARADQVADIESLAAAWLAGEAWNQPIRSNFFQSPANGLHAEIGHDRYAAAKARAIELGLV